MRLAAYLRLTNKPVAPLSSMARVFSLARCTPMQKCLECGSISCKRYEETVAYIVGVGLGTCGVSVAGTGTLVNLGDTGGAAVRVFTLGVESLGLQALLPDDEGEGGKIRSEEHTSELQSLRESRMPSSA